MRVFVVTDNVCCLNLITATQQLAILHGGVSSVGCQMSDMLTLQRECGSTSNAAKLAPHSCL